MEATGQMINLYSLALTLAVMFLGMFFHWLKKKRRREVSGNFVSYLFADNPKSSAVAGSSIVFTAIAAAASGAADIIDPRLLWSLAVNTGSIPAMSLFALGGTFATGWGMDSGLNKGE